MVKHIPLGRRWASNVSLDSVSRKVMHYSLVKANIHSITAVEKNNDDARRNYFSSNKWDGAKDILLTEARLEMLKEYARVKRGYNKTNIY